MTKYKPSDELKPAELESKFGEDADLYAEVRAEAAAATGRSKASRKWEKTAAELTEKEDPGIHHE